MIVGLIHNVKLNKWHPVYFRHRPLPGEYDPNAAQRYKSGGHHTTGFDTREAGLEGAKKLAEDMKPHSLGTVTLCLDADFPWDGEGIPAMVVFFGTQKDKVVPLF